MSKSNKKGQTKIRLPLPKKSGGPMSTPKAGKGYDRKREREEIEREIAAAESESEEHGPEEG